MKTFSVVIAACIFGLVLLSNKGGVNISHKHNVSGHREAYTISCSGWFTETCHVTLDREISSSDDYKPLIMKLQKAQRLDQFVFHFVGFGGSATTGMALVNAIRYSKASTHGIIEGPVYSMHAVLSFSTDTTEARSGSFIMVHHVNILNDTSYCSKAAVKQPSDRGQSTYLKCLYHAEFYLDQFAQLMYNTVGKYMTKKEFGAVLRGHDVYIPAREVNKRLKGRVGQDWTPEPWKMKARSSVQDWKAVARGEL